MSEAEKEALAWLHRWTAMIAGCDDQKHAYTLQAMLAGPRMPEDPSEALFSAMKGAFHAAATFPSAWRRIYAAIRAELMKPPPPKTKMVPCWMVEWRQESVGGFIAVTYRAINRADAEHVAASYRRYSHISNVMVVEREIEVPA